MGSTSRKEDAWMWTLSGFSDEIADDFDEQCRVASGLGLRYLEVRSAWGRNILDLDADQLERLQSTPAAYGRRAPRRGPQCGKTFIGEPFGPHLDRMRHAADVATRLGAPYIRIFSF